MSAPHQLFKLPETVTAILSNLPRKQDLFASLQVNVLWAEEATTLLWADTPPISALAALHERSDRLDFYAQKVKSLDFADDDCLCHRFFVNTSFPRLADISIDSSDDNCEDVLLQYLQPRLRRFQFFGGPISDAFLMQIQARCPSINSVLIDYPRGKITTDGLLNFLKATPSISSICSCAGLPVTEPVWCQLAKQASLESLSLVNDLTAEHIATIIDTVPVPFGHLTSLECETHSTNFVRLIPYLLRLQELTLHLTSQSTCILSEVSHMKHLREFTMQGANNMDPQKLLLLAERCKSLLHLDIDDTQANGDLNDGDVKRLSELAPQLRTLRLSFQGRLTSQALKYLGSICHRLEKCLLPGSFDLLALETTHSCLFPHLQVLELYHPTKYDNAYLKNITAVLSHHMPQLEELDTGGGNSDLDQSVVDCIIARRENSLDQNG